MTPKNRNILYLVAAVAVILLVQWFWTSREQAASIPYSEFKRLLDDKQVTEIWISSNQIRGQLTKPLTGGQSAFVTTRVEMDLASELAKQGVKFSGRIESTFLPTLLSWVIPALIFLGIWLFLMKRMSGKLGSGGGLMSIGKSKAKVFVETDTKVAFRDVAGVDEAKDELQEVVNFLEEPESYGRLGARMPRGVLLVGPPGTGKTLLARAVAGEAGVPFFSITGSEFVEMFVGVGAARVRDLFVQARLQSPCIIFIDELDALGRARTAGPTMGGHDEKEQTLNQLLAELDGFDPTSGIVLLGSTNRPEILDPALLRAGRFDRQILVDRPDRRGRVEILEVHLPKVTVAEGFDVEAVAAMTPGFTGADLANLVNEAALVATRRDAGAVEMPDFTAAIERIVAGLEKKNRLLNPREREVVAHHEMGHALVAAALPGTDPVHKISIIPRGIGALGYTMQRPTEDRYLMTSEELESKLAVLQGGRVAEQLVFGHLSTGAADDLAKSTEIARSMVTRFAMTPALGHMTYETEPASYLGLPGSQRRDYSEETAREIDCAVRGIVEAAFERARGALEQNRELLEVGARELLDRESLAGDDLARLLDRVSQKTKTLPVQTAA